MCVPALALSEIILPIRKATDLSIVIMSLTWGLGPELYSCSDAVCISANISHT